jgi:hypothetical protein
MEDNAVAAYAAQLERVILIAAEALRAGDAGYAERLLAVIEARILDSMAEMEAEGRTVH